MKTLLMKQLRLKTMCCPCWFPAHHHHHHHHHLCTTTSTSVYYNLYISVLQPLRLCTTTSTSLYYNLYIFELQPLYLWTWIYLNVSLYCILSVSTYSLCFLDNLCTATYILYLLLMICLIFWFSFTSRNLFSLWCDFHFSSRTTFLCKLPHWW